MKNKTYWNFWWPIPILLLMLIVFGGPVIQLHDLYIPIVVYRVSLILLIVFLFISGIGYYYFRITETLVRLRRAHLILTILGLISFIFFSILNLYLKFRTYQEKFVEYENIEIFIFILQSGSVLMIFSGFICYLINMYLTSKRNLKTLN